MGHTSGHIYQQYYQSNVSMVDIKGIILRGKSDEGFTTTALRRNRRLQRLPTRLPSRANQEFLNAWNEACTDGKETRDHAGKRLRKASWSKLRASWNHHHQTITVPAAQEGSKIPHSIEKLGDLDHYMTRSRIMLRFDKHRKALSEAATMTSVSMRHCTVLGSMISLASRDYKHPAVWYAGEEPRESPCGELECPSCRLTIGRWVFSSSQDLHQLISHSARLSNTSRFICADAQPNTRPCQLRESGCHSTVIDAVHGSTN